MNQRVRASCDFQYYNKTRQHQYILPLEELTQKCKKAMFESSKDITFTALASCLLLHRLFIPSTHEVDVNC